MKVFLRPLMPFLLLLLLLPDGIFSNNCPESCSCMALESILCFQRQSATFPRGLNRYIKGLYLFSNGIESITAEDFDDLVFLEMMDLSQNKLTHLPDRVFEPLTSLKNLDLSANQISHISEKCFHGLTKLERLYLHGNSIKTIHPAAFNGLEHLLELKLQGNMLTSLPTLSLPQLLLLDLRFNALPSIGPTDLQTPNLESLRLGGVGLTHLNKELILSLKNLHELDISGNQLKSFPLALKETSGLIELNLAGNPIGTLKTEDLQNLKELSDLNISSLSLQGLPEDFSQLFPNLRKLTVAENPFNCLCNLAWFPRWLRTQNIILEKTEETRCHFPLINAGKILSKLEHRDFGCPTTTTITTSTVKTTTTTLPAPTTTISTTTRIIQIPRASDNPEGNDFNLHPIPTSDSSSSTDPDYFCPPNTCLNGGTCHLDQYGHVKCACPYGTNGMFCEVPNTPPPEPPVIVNKPDLSSGQETPTSILLYLHRYFDKRPYLRGIRLTYSNLSGPDNRPHQLNLPSSIPEYTLGGLNPNSTYAICIKPLGDSTDRDRICIQARTASKPEKSTDPERLKPTMMVPATAIVLALVLIALVVGVVCYIRRKRSKGNLDLDLEPSHLELDGVKTELGNGALPHKQTQLMIPEPMVQNDSLDYEVSLIQDHCTSNNNMSLHKPYNF